MTLVGCYCWVATVVCMTGTAINVKRMNACFVFWAVGEVMWLALDVSRGTWSRALLDLLGLAFALWGAWENIAMKQMKGKER